MKKAFISYRRQDSPGHVRAVHDRLRQHFHPDQIFMDVEDIPLGQDFVTVLDHNLQDCVAMIVVIGPNWLDISSSDGSRRLDKPNDFVRLEIQQALHRNISVIPILVDDAMMPSEGQLPDVLKPLARRQALALDNKHYDYGINALTIALEKLLGKPSVPQPAPIPVPKNRLPLLVGLGTLCVLGAAGVWLLTPTTPDTPNPNPVRTQQPTLEDPDDENDVIPTAAAGFNCNKASNDVEDAICNSNQTRRSDKQLNRVYQQLFQRLPPTAQERLNKRQLGWVQQRNTHIRQNCFIQPNKGRITNCINNYYQQRISTLSRLPVSLFSRVKVTDLPTNIHRTPNGELICQIREQQIIEVYTDAILEQDGGNWYATRVCGESRWGMVHESQISTVR